MANEHKKLSELTHYLDCDSLDSAMPIINKLLNRDELREMGEITIPANQLITLLCTIRDLHEIAY